MENISQSSFAKTLKSGADAGQTTFHVHNGSDSPRIPQASIMQFVEPVRWTIPGIQAATATNYGVIFIADRPCTVVGFQEVHQTKGTDVGAVTLQLEKLTGTTVLGSGINLLQTALSLKATINTIQEGVMAITNTGGVRDVSLAVGDRLALSDSGTLTALANVTITIFIQYQ